MQDMNKIILIGKLGADPVFKTLPSGYSIAKFPLATSRRVKKTKENTEEETTRKQNQHTEWHNVVAWGKQAELCEQYLKKGDPLFVIGEVRTRKYEQEGITKYWSEVHVSEMNFLGSLRSATKFFEEEITVAEVS